MGARLSQQRRHFRQGIGARLRPARALTDVGVGDGDVEARLAQRLVEQRLLLRAGDEERPAFRRRGAKVLDLGAAELRVDEKRALAAAGPAERLTVEGHRPCAVAHQQFAAAELHPPFLVPRRLDDAAQSWHYCRAPACLGTGTQGRQGLMIRALLLGFVAIPISGPVLAVKSCDQPLKDTQSAFKTSTIRPRTTQQAETTITPPAHLSNEPHAPQLNDFLL